MAAPLHTRPRPRPVRPARTVEGYRKRRPFRSDEVVGATLLALLVAMLLGSQALVDLASRQPYGASRTVLVTLARGVHRVASAASLDRPARAIGHWTGRTPTAPIDVDEVLRGLSSPASPVTTIPLDVNPATGLRWVDAAHPLRIHLIGDSLMGDLAGPIETIAPVDRTRITLDHRVSSGLSRPDFFDWPSHLARLLQDAGTAPEAVVALFGPNDFQDVEVGGAVLTAGSPAWDDLYRKRVGVAMDLLQGPGTTLTWLTLPAMREPELSAAMAHLSALYRSEAATRPWVSIVELGTVLDRDGGGYARDLTGPDGTTPPLRQDDGVHLTRAGADRAAAPVWADLARRWGIDG